MVVDGLVVVEVVVSAFLKVHLVRATWFVVLDGRSVVPFKLGDIPNDMTDLLVDVGGRLVYAADVDLIVDVINGLRVVNVNEGSVVVLRLKPSTGFG